MQPRFKIDGFWEESSAVCASSLIQLVCPKGKSHGVCGGVCTAADQLESHFLCQILSYLVKLGPFWTNWVNCGRIGTILVKLGHFCLIRPILIKNLIAMGVLGQNQSMLLTFVNFGQFRSIMVTFGQFSIWVNLNKIRRKENGTKITWNGAVKSRLSFSL